ncbi:MAG: hypothetical protein M3P08_02720 [Thermoproteota archaeon]|nr:hypothetical protein [Thermoproteota archaeon]
MVKGVDILPPGQNFRGLSYGDWAGIWWNWLLSKDPDSYNGHEMLFLRGNVSYGPLGGVKGAPRDLGGLKYYDRTDDKGEKIWTGTPVFFPIINAAYCLGDMYDGIKLTEETDLRHAARKDIVEGGEMRAEISFGTTKSAKIVNNLKEYFIESSLFELSVSSNSKIRHETENAFSPGKYECVTAGYYILIKSLHAGKYRIQFEARGRGSYYTKSIYDITVKGQKIHLVKDVSNSQIIIEHK